MATVDVAGLRFAYAEDGSSDAPVVLLLHGFPQDHTSWDEISRGLVAAGYRTIRPDQRGYSPGARPADVEAYRLSTLAGDAFGLLDALGVDRAHVVGHDWGGAVAWAMAAERPERLLSLTVLSTPHPAALSRAMVRSSQGLRSWYMGVFQVPGLAERLLKPGGRFWAGIMRGLPAEARTRYSQRALEPGALTPMLNWYRAMARDIVRPSVRWRSIDVPTVYIWGSDDPALGEAAARGTSAFVRAPYRLVVLLHQGHWLPERAAGEVLTAMLPHLAEPGTS